ncbi:hypothetical protein BZA77DRAFT_330649 [Pyronema omphalodes]|nr:hypothetical protein BZA77DRAFT_330649 [Pyronema omphalodes]
MVLFKPLLSAALLLTTTLANPDSNLPVSSLLASADALLAQGDKHGALSHFDAAVAKDPSNYLTLFKRGATYLSLGRSSQASADFDAVLELKPDFKAAFLQRAGLKAKTGEWKKAKEDYSKGGKEQEREEVERAETAAELVKEAEARGDWETCQVLELRQNLPEAVGDLMHVAQLNPGNTDPHLQIANILYWSLNDFDKSTAQLRKCLHSDPDSKSCSKLLRRIKNTEKAIGKARKSREQRMWNSANKVLLGDGEDTGILDDVKADLDELMKDDLQDMICNNFVEMKKPEKAKKHCEEAFRLNPSSIPAIVFKASSLLEAESFEEAIRLLEKAREEVDGAARDSRINNKLNEAQKRLRQSKTKDYYKVLGLSRDANEREIKKAYRKLTKQYHPDKYRGDMTPEQIQTKMSQINEAYEVLSNPELKERFDNGDDPNSQEQQNPFHHGGNPFAHFGGQQQFMFRQPGGNPFSGGGFNFQF